MNSLLFNYIKTIVLIEDDLALTSLIRFKVEEKNLEFISFVLGNQALPYICQHADHILLVVDYELPDTNGLTLIEEVKKTFPQIPFIAITGAGSEKIASQFLRLGALDYIVKDFGFLEHFNTSIDNVLQKITLQKQNEYQQKIIAEKEYKYQLIFNNITDVYAIIDHHFKIIEISPSVFNLLNIPAGMLINKTFFYLIPQKKEWKELYKKLKNDGYAENYELQIYNKTKKIKKICYVNARLVDYYNQRVVIVTLRDITEIKRLQQELLQVTTLIEERERTKLSENLHDFVAPLLSVAKIQLSRALDENKTADEKKQLIQETIQIIDDAVQKIRNISNDMISNVLTEFGLEKSLMYYLQRFKGSEFPVIHFSFQTTNERYPAFLENIVYRTCIELVNNGIKHSQSSNIELSICEENKVLKLLYKDYGIGFEFDADKLYRKNNEMGLFSIIHRIKSLDGKIYFSRPEKGVIFEIEIPINENKVL